MWNPAVTGVEISRPWGQTQSRRHAHQYLQMATPPFALNFD